MTDEKEKKCKEYWCNRETWKDGEHCIFHSKDIEGKKDEFDEQFWKEFERQKKDEEEYDFRRFIFPGDILFGKIEFEKDAKFEEAQFSGEVDFGNARFSGLAGFSYAKFSENAIFVYTQFSEGAIFRDVEFYGVTDFTDAKFSERATFVYTQFSEWAFFRRVKFSGVTDFAAAKFSEMAEFSYAQFSGEVNFFGSTFSGEALGGLFASLRNEGIMRILKGRYKIKDFRFHLGEEIAKEYPMIDRMTKDAWYLDDFKNNFPFFYKLWWLFADCGRSFKRWLLWCFIIAFLFGAVFAEYPVPDIQPQFLQDVLTWMNPKFQIDPGNRIPTFFTPYYFSIVTFTTLGFGDVIPLNLAGEIWLAIEVILGYIMLGGLISILANKLARRS